MKGLTLTVLLLLFIPQKAFSQIDEKDLIGTWLPIGIRQLDQEDYHESPAILLVFEENGTGMRKGTGGNLTDLPFTFKHIGDSLEWNFGGEISKAKVLLLSEDKMTFTWDSTNVLGLIRLPQIDAGISLSEFKQVFENETWEMTIDSRHGPYSILYQFEDHVLDSGLTDYRIWHRDLGLRSYQNGITDAIRQSWTVTETGTLILGIDREFSSLGSFTLLLQGFHTDSMAFSIWDEGIERQVLMKRLEKPSQKQSKKQLNRLTKYKWKFYSEYIPPPESIDTANIMELGIVEDDFVEDSQWYPTGYLRDSTLLLTQKDLDNKLLILDFSKEGKYAIYRDKRLLDEGNWRYLFNKSVLELKSEKAVEMSDGIFGGTLQIISLKKNEMKLYREIEGFLDSQSYHYPYSYLETYKPYRKRK